MDTGPKGPEPTSDAAATGVVLFGGFDLDDT
jgi:hypothetical protein